MCEFVSWVETKNDKGNKYLFLTRALIDSEKGKRLLKDLPQDDLLGHGAIRLFFGLTQDEGINREYVDFSSPANFPLVIAKAIKRGEFRGFSTPQELLTAQAWKQREEITAPAWKQYKEIEAQAWKQREEITAPALKQREEIEAQAWKQYKEITAQALKQCEEIEAQAWKQYKEIEAQALKQYKEIEAPALKQYKEIEAPALKQYKEIEAQAFWDLFAVPENRQPAWR